MEMKGEERGFLLALFLECCPFLQLFLLRTSLAALLIPYPVLKFKSQREFSAFK